VSLFTRVFLNPNFSHQANPKLGISTRLQNIAVLSKLKISKILLSRDLNVDGEIILEWILWKQRGMHVAQDRDQSRAILNIVINLQVPYKAGNFVTS
jgi:hypothetical protein